MIFDAIRRWLGSGPGGPGGPGDGNGHDMASCEEALARVHEFLDGELDDVPRESVAEHFRICTRCYPHLAMERSFREALRRTLRGQEAPAALRARVLDLLEREAAGG